MALCIQAFEGGRAARHSGMRREHAVTLRIMFWASGQLFGIFSHWNQCSAKVAVGPHQTCQLGGQ